MDASTKKMDDGRVVRMESESDLRDGLAVVPPTTFAAVVDGFCIEQAKFQARLSRIGNRVNS